MLSEAVRKRMIKLLNMTASTADNEALSAIRLVSELLKKEGLSWEVVIAQLSPAPRSRPGVASYRPSNPPPAASSVREPFRGASQPSAGRWGAAAASNARSNWTWADQELHKMNTGGSLWEDDQRAWIVDRQVVSGLFAELKNSGYVFSERELMFRDVALAKWIDQGRISEKQFAILAALAERERRAASERRF